MTAAPAPTARRRSRSRRVSLLDRSWAGHWSAIAVGPLTVPTLEALRSVVGGFVATHPTHVLASRLDASRRRWVSVPPAERQAHVDRLVRPGEPLDLGAIPATLHRHRPPLDADLPFVAVLSAGSLLVYFAHPAGDVATFTDLVHRLSIADGDGLAALEPTAGLALVARGALHQSRTVHRGWWDHVVGGRDRRRATGPATGPTSGATLGPTSTTAAQTPGAVRASSGDRSGAGTGPAPDAVGVVLSNAEIRGLTRWRNEHARGASLTAVLATLTYRGLVAQGVPVDGGHFYSLFDVRAYLPEGTTGVRGNLAKSLRLDADLADPVAIDRAIKDVTASRRALPALLVGGLAALRGHRLPASGALAEPLVLTVNSMPSLPALEKMPWAGTGPRRYFGVGYPTGAAGVSLFVIRLRDRLELTLSFDRGSVDPAAAQRAVDRVPAVAGLVGQADPGRA